MAWWHFRKEPREVVRADWMGEKLAEMFDPTRSLGIVTEAYPTLAEVDTPFLALASLRLVGFQLGAMQQSVTSRIARSVMEQIQLSYIAALIERYVDFRARGDDPTSLIRRLIPLGKRIHDVFMDGRKRARPPDLHPTWFAGKEACLFLTGDPSHLNPELIMCCAQFLHEALVETKKLFDELLDSRVQFAISSSTPREMVATGGMGDSVDIEVPYAQTENRIEVIHAGQNSAPTESHTTRPDSNREALVNSMNSEEWERQLSGIVAEFGKDNPAIDVRVYQPGELNPGAPSILRVRPGELAVTVDRLRREFGEGSFPVIVFVEGAIRRRFMLNT
jgi:hypothetical protein